MLQEQACLDWQEAASCGNNHPDHGAHVPRTDFVGQRAGPGGPRADQGVRLTSSEREWSSRKTRPYLLKRTTRRALSSPAPLAVQPREFRRRANFGNAAAAIIAALSVDRPGDGKYTDKPTPCPRAAARNPELQATPPEIYQSLRADTFRRCHGTRQPIRESRRVETKPINRALPAA